MTEPANEDDRTVQAHAGSLSVGSANARGQAIDEHDSGGRLPIGMRLAEFEIIGYVGDGGFSIVYLAWDHSLERQVALKEYMPSSLASRSGDTRVYPRSERHRDTFDAGLKSFINEGKLLAQFDHPSLVKVYRFWESHGTAYMVMPYYEGMTLKDAVRAMPQPPDEAWLRSLLDPLMAALSVLHQAQCFHRDIAPDNVLLLAGSGKPLLLDFGAARRVIGDKTQALTVILKPGFAPIEQYAEDSTMRQGAWTDVYALAAVIYWAVTGKTPPTSVGRVLNDSYVPLAQSAAGRYSPSFLGAVDRALVVLPDRRTPSIERLREDIESGGEWSQAASPAQAPVDTEATIIRPNPAQNVPRAQIEQTATLPVAKNPVAANRADVPKPSLQRSAAARRSLRTVLLWAGMVALLAGVGVWWFAQPRPPPVSTAESGAALVAPPAPSALPPEPPLPAPSPPSAQAVLAEINAGRDVTVDLEANLLTERNGAKRLQYQASESGYAYLMGSRTDSNELVMLYPPGGRPAAKLGMRGKVDVLLPTTAGAQTYHLLWAREERDLAAGGWTLRSPGWVHSLEAGTVPSTAQKVWGAPRCAPSVQVCDPAYAMTEVTDMTKVIAPAQAPVSLPSVGAKVETPALEKPVSKVREKAPPTEGKPAVRGKSELSARCRELLNRASLGDTGADLIAQLRTQNCGG